MREISEKLQNTKTNIASKMRFTNVSTILMHCIEIKIRMVRRTKIELVCGTSHIHAHKHTHTHCAAIVSFSQWMHFRIYSNVMNYKNNSSGYKKRRAKPSRQKSKLKRNETWKMGEMFWKKIYQLNYPESIQ